MSVCTFDIVIPTVRLNSEHLTQLLNIDAPVGVALRYIVVVDRPGAERESWVESLFRREDIVVLVNEQNLGAASSRNRGIDAATGDFILFLDDDVIPRPGLIAAYWDAIKADPTGSPGYVGVTRFPAPGSRFARGVLASDILTFFDIAHHRSQVAWGVTANLCLRRSAVGDIRFRALFPKLGGGEDIDFCLLVSQAAGGSRFRCVPGAVVVHPWWDGERRSYQRFFRWAYGDSRLPSLHPHLRYRNAPSLPEVALLAAIVFPVLAGPSAVFGVVGFLIGAALVEFTVDYLKLRLRGLRVEILTSAEATLVRLANDLGRISAHLRAFRPAGMLERFDYFVTGESIQEERLVAGTKLAGWLILGGALLLMLV